MTRVETIGNATLYLGDCRNILPTLERPAAILSDPPYGQQLNTNVTGKSVTGRALGAGRPYAASLKVKFPKYQSARSFPTGITGDDEPFDPALILAAADRVLLWGAHKFGDRLPRGRWLGWDKVPTGKVRDQGDGELAWTNVDVDAPLRLFRLLWDGVCVGAAARHEVTAGVQRAHPTQKPEALMHWCLPFLKTPQGGVICDPYMGAGSAGIAACHAGHPFIGIEIELEYFDRACERISAAQRQGRIFAPAEVQQSEQAALL